MLILCNFTEFNIEKQAKVLKLS